jgi:Zn-dependent M28 family amino/carboxypeptidase
MASRRGLRRLRVFALLALVAAFHAACSQPTSPLVLPDLDDRAAEHIEAFAAAEKLGDGPGSEGETMAMEYARQYFEDIGLETSVQSVPLLRMTPMSTSVQVIGPGNVSVFGSDATDDPNYLIWSGHENEQAAVVGEIVFAGYGIVSPEYTRDDYKGVDVTGKLVLVLEGTPHTADRDDLGVLGETYYSQPFYKFIEAKRHGAAAVIIVHEDVETWEEARRSDDGSVIDIETSPGAIADHAVVEGFLSPAAAEVVFGSAGLDLDTLNHNARELSFQPTTLAGLRAEIEISSTIERLTSHDVIAVQRGQTPELLMLSARWNRLPFDIATGPGGGSGAAVVMETARRLVHMEKVARELGSETPEPRRGVVYMVSSGLAEGIVGLRYYADHPSILPTSGSEKEELPLDKTIGHIFLDHAAPDQPSHAVGKIGSNSGRVLAHMLRSAAINQRRLVVLDQSAERRFYYSYSQSAFARRGVPTLYLTTPPDHEYLKPLQADEQTEALAAPEGFDLDASLLVELLTMMASTTHFPREPPPLRP